MKDFHSGSIQTKASAKILILGGISEAKKLAQQLHSSGFSLIYSIQGGVRKLKADYDVAAGGFSQYSDTDSPKDSSLSGLINFIRKNQITLLVDATHPYADTISNTALETSKRLNIPYLQYTRPPWNKDELTTAPLFLKVQELSSYEQILSVTQEFNRLFWAIGYNSISNLTHKLPSHQRWIFRTAKETSAEDLKNLDQVATGIDTIKQIGPFSVEHEIDLFQQKQIDALICKNSGGNFNEAKLKAASALDIPVFLLKRPNKIAANCQYSSIETLFNAIIARI
ncbi:hypothetical protein A9Q81_11060 [Gammaproteobacteria bacterium 42_54_T18]|nr:hypothetical protein A9Q81_11060 [Gammaproteobacteria bacterium 42_54_T18]